MMMKKLEVPSTCGRAEQQLHRASYVKINSKKTKDLNKKTWTDEIVKENRNASKDWKGERFILFYPISRSTENISKKIYIYYMKLHQTVKASAQGREQLTQNKKQPSK